MLTNKGQLSVIKPNNKEYEPIAEHTVSDRQTWAMPVFLGDRLIRDDTTLLCYRIGSLAGGGTR